MSPSQVEASHTSYELQEWQAYFKLEEVEREQKKTTAKIRADLGIE